MHANGDIERVTLRYSASRGALVGATPLLVTGTLTVQKEATIQNKLVKYLSADIEFH